MEINGKAMCIDIYKVLLKTFLHNYVSEESVIQYEHRMAHLIKRWLHLYISFHTRKQIFITFIIHI